MDTIRINGALANERNEEFSTSELARDSSTEGIRQLQEWELALAGGGGEFDPCWP